MDDTTKTSDAIAIDTTATATNTFTDPMKKNTSTDIITTDTDTYDDDTTNININTNVVQNNETILLYSNDNHNDKKRQQIFGYCSITDRKKSIIKLNKRTYTTLHLIGIPYGTILEVTTTISSNGVSQHKLVPLPIHETLIPNIDIFNNNNDDENDDDDDNNNNDYNDTDEHENDNTTTNTSTNTNTTATTTTTSITKDNRNLIDTNTAQLMNYDTLQIMKQQGCSSIDIISSLITNSTTYNDKTNYSKEKYLMKKLKKHTTRYQLIQCNTVTIVDTLYMNNSKKYMNLRSDTIGQILNYSNIYSGCNCLVYDTNYGIVLSSICQRLNGYGIIYCIYNTQLPSYQEMFMKFNLNFQQLNTIQYIHTSDIFYNNNTTTTTNSNETSTNNNNHNINNNETDTTNEIDLERIDRDKLQWPCILQDHTRQYIQSQLSQDDDQNNQNNIKQQTHISNFLIKRSSRFARKLCRNTSLEAKQSLCKLLPTSTSSTTTTTTTTTTSEKEKDTTTTNTNAENNADANNNSNSIMLNPIGRLCDSLILVTKYDPTITLIQLFPYLAPSSPYVIYCEYIEPLTECFYNIQNNPLLLSINLRLSDTWMREYQILPNRTHPAMSMSQSGGFILTGIKLHPITGYHEFNDIELQNIRNEIGGGRRARNNKPKKTNNTTTGTSTTNTTTTNNKKRKEPPG